MPGGPKGRQHDPRRDSIEIDEEHAGVGRAWLEQRMLDSMAEVLGLDTHVSVEVTIANNWGEKG